MVGLFTGQELAVIKLVGILQQAFYLCDDNLPASPVNGGSILLLNGENDIEDGRLLFSEKKQGFL